jgi:hypothetical protein
MTTPMNWENKLVFCVTNVGFSNYNGCYSTTSNNGFLTVLIFYGVALLSSCEIDSSSTLKSNKVFCRYLVIMRNPCIGCKDCAPISVSL